MGLIQGRQLASGTIVVETNTDSTSSKPHQAILYAQVSSAANKTKLDAQLSRLRDYATAKGYTIIREVKESGSGLNDKRPLLESDNWTILVAEHKDRLTRFGLNFVTILLQQQGRQIDIINQASDSGDDLMQDFVAIITSFTARLYGLRRSKRKTEQIISQLENDTE